MRLWDGGTVKGGRLVGSFNSPYSISTCNLNHKHQEPLQTYPTIDSLQS